MELLDHLHLPRRLSARVWLISLPSALISFERQQKMPRLPIGGMRFLGLPLILAGAGLAVWAWRTPGATVQYNGPFAHMARHPATAGGVLVLAGAALLTRSVVLAAYSAGLVVASGNGSIAIEDPDLEGILGRRR